MRDRSISRRAALSLLPAPLFSQQVQYRDYSRCLPDYLRQLVAQAVATRDAALAKLTTVEAIKQRQQWVRKTFWQLTGGEPEKTPLNLRVTAGFERSTYRVEKLLYESQPGVFVSANLYIPKAGRAPYPGVLFQMGHANNGKASGLYQKCCQGMAQLGFVVLAFDPMGQGERVNYPQADSPATRLRSADDEHTHPGQQMLLLGETATKMQAWDAVRSLDVLASLPMVDPKRLSSTGNSGGGTVTMFLTAIDDRLACAAPSCPNSENFACPDFNPPGSTDDAEQNFVNAGPVGFDRWDLLYPMAPKPLLITLSGKDFFGTYSSNYIKNGRAEFARLKSAYQRLGSNNLQWFESPLPHGLVYTMRMEIYKFLVQHLQGGKPPEEEPPTKPEADETLLVDPKGNVVRTKHHVFLSEKQIKRTPADLKTLLGLGELPTSPRNQKLSQVQAEGCTIEAGEVAVTDKVWAPYWIYRPRRVQKADEMILMLDSAGRNAKWAEEGLCHQLAQKGLNVCSMDVRAIGDLLPEAGRGATRQSIPHATEHAYAWASVMLGKPLVGQRVTDILALIRSMPGIQFTVVANGRLTIPALFAAAMEPRVAKLYLAGGLASFRHLIEVEQYREPFASFIPNILLHTDLPEVAKLMKGTLSLGGMMDARTATLQPALMERLYPNAKLFPDAAFMAERISGL